MNHANMVKFSLFFIVLGMCGAGCHSGNVGLVQSYSAPSLEAAWIRSGEPILFEDESWHPKDVTEILMDSEVYLLGDYRGVQFFADKTDVRPFNRLYTKFGPNQYRLFEKDEKP